MYVSVLCEPFMLARVPVPRYARVGGGAGSSAAARCRLAPLVISALARSFPVAGAKADANGFLWPLSRQGSAAARRGRRAQQRCSPSFQTCKGALRAMPPGILPISRGAACLPRLLKMPAASLAQE